MPASARARDLPVLLAVPNVSEGRDGAAIAAIAAAFGRRARLLDVHSDADHNRSVFTLAAAPTALCDALLEGAAEVLARVRVGAAATPTPGRPAAPVGQHPHVGALDVAPLIHLDGSTRGAACAQALVLADRIASELQIPVFLYGELTASAERPERTRAQLRRGGVEGLSARVDAGELAPDFGPRRLHPSAGATLVAARAPLVAFNLQLAPGAGIESAREVAARIREGGVEGLPGVRAIAVQLSGAVAQVSTNVERPAEVPLALLVERVARLAPLASAEIVGLVPEAALVGLPDELPLLGFDRARQVIERALAL